MKKVLLSVLLLLVSISFSIAQTIDVVTVSELPTRMTSSGNDLYFSAGSISSSNAGKIYKVDTTNSQPIVPTLVYDGFATNDLLFVGNDLYIALFWENKIVKMDVTIGQSSLTDVVATSSNPSGLLLIGNDLFYTEVNGDTLSKIDITNLSGTPEVILNTLTSPYDLLWHNNELYISELSKISKVDPYSTSPTKIDVITTGVDGVLGMRFFDNMIFAADQMNNRVFKFDPSLSTPLLIDVVSSLNRPVDVEVINNELYISIINSLKLVKLSSPLLSINQFKPQDVFLYPNPIQDILFVKNISKKMPYVIFSMDGKKIKEDFVLNEQIDISMLQSGVYILKIGDKVSKRITKL